VAQLVAQLGSEDRNGERIVGVDVLVDRYPMLVSVLRTVRLVQRFSTNEVIRVTQDVPFGMALEGLTAADLAYQNAGSSA